jgi:aspartate/glutamate racemase
MRNVLTIGVLGGMGPQATNYLCSLITEMTPARTDQEHIPVIAYNNSAIPSRLDAVLRGGPSPVPELVATARKLETAGADFIIMPCNTAHFFIEDVVAALGIPVLDMIELTVQHIRGAMPEVQQVGILASTVHEDRHKSADTVAISPAHRDGSYLWRARNQGGICGRAAPGTEYGGRGIDGLRRRRHTCGLH